MRLPLLLVLPLLVLNGLVDWYICGTIDRRKHKLLRSVVLWSSVIFALFFVFIIAVPKKSGSDSDLLSLMWSLFAYFTVYIGKYFYCFVDLLGKIPCMFRRRRIRGFRVAGLIIGCGASALIVWGAFNRYSIDVEKVEIIDPTLPRAFDGFRIVQLSDIHTGTYGTDSTFLSRVVDRVNELNPDLILFTGDIVNRHSTELEPFVGTLGRLKARYGVYSVLGNHDYGDYFHWGDETAKLADRRNLARLQGRMGWRLLNNEHQIIRCGADSLVIIGVENIGDPPFPVYGDLDAAYPTLDDNSFKILMSHNPVHWVDDIMDAPDKNIALTLSGHTHAMQMSILGLSPAAFRYRTWGGLYESENSNNRLYVNIGIGEVGFPARIGATPEITLFTLRSEN